MNERTCSVDGCDAPAWRVGWCGTHYQRQRRHGDLFTHIPVGHRGHPLTDCTCARCAVNPWVHRAPRCPRGHGPDLVLLYMTHNGVEWWNCIEPLCSGKRFIAEASRLAEVPA